MSAIQAANANEDDETYLPFNVIPATTTRPVMVSFMRLMVCDVKISQEKRVGSITVSTNASDSDSDSAGVGAGTDEVQAA